MKFFTNLKKLKEAPPRISSTALKGRQDLRGRLGRSVSGGNHADLTVTYLKVFDAIRRLFATADLSRMRGYTPSTFSFNEGGRCETCRGEGFEKIEMQFLSDVYTSCPECHGSRYREEILEVTYRGKNIRQILDLTVSEAIEFFKDLSEIKEGLYPLRRRLECCSAQHSPHDSLRRRVVRLKLAAHMAEGQEGRNALHFR